MVLEVEISPEEIDDPVRSYRVAPPKQLAIMTKLDGHYKHLDQVLFRYRSYTTGLYPRYSNNTKEGHIRDSIYCAMACWACGTAYQRLDDDRGRPYELGQSTVKTMRGILLCWMRQIDKLEQFKKGQNHFVCLHSKFDLQTGNELPEAIGYGHLQLDVVALYLLVLVQMITSGLEIIFTQHEVNFIQNLVFYIERAYRIPDFGMWEVGSRYNDGHPELHASSVGIVKAALEAINGFNVFGVQRNCGECHLCFATHDPQLLNKTLDKVSRKLCMKYGYKRFLRDGHGTMVDCGSKPLYTLSQTTEFQDIECQWPMFNIFLTLHHYFRGDADKEMHRTWHKVKESLIPSSLPEHERVGEHPVYIVPQYYYVQKEAITRERSKPGSTVLMPCSELGPGLFLWSQALEFITSLLLENLIHRSDVDPIYRHLPASQRPKNQARHSVFQGSMTNKPVVQVALIAENAQLMSLLSTYGIQTQTPHQVEPVSIWPSQRLVQVFNNLGKNDALKLSGRPPRPIGTLGTCKIYRVFGETVLCYPLLFDVSDFYIAADPTVLIDDIKEGLSFVSNRWKLGGRPTFCVVLKEENIRGDHFKQMLQLLRGFMDGCVDGIRVRVSRVQNLLSASCVEHLDFADPANLDDISVDALSDCIGRPRLKSLLTSDQSVCIINTDDDFDMTTHMNKSDPELVGLLNRTSSTSLKTQADILGTLWDRQGPNFMLQLVENDKLVSVREAMEQVYREAGTWKKWTTVRYCAARLRKVVDSLAPSVTSLLVRGKQITFGIRGHEEVYIQKPLTPLEIETLVFRVTPVEYWSSAVIQQELVLALAHIVEHEPQLFNGIITIRLGWLMEALETMLNFNVTRPTEDLPPSGQRKLSAASPTYLKKLVHDLLARKHWDKLSPLQQRRLNGALNRVPTNFHDEVWKILERCPDGFEIAGKHMPQQPTLTEMTQFELNFALAVEELLGRIKHPELRQVMVELMVVVATVLKRNPELRFSEVVVMENLVKDAFELYANDNKITDLSNMTPFYQLKGEDRTYLAKAVLNKLLCASIRGGQSADCTIS